MSLRKALASRPLLVAYALIVAAGVAAILWQNHLGQERKEQICYAEIEDRLLFKDIIEFVGSRNQSEAPIDENLPVEVQKLIRDSRERSQQFRKYADTRINLPPTICDDTGINVDKVRADQIRRGQREE